VIAPQCPFAARTVGSEAMTTCPGFLPEPLTALFAGDTCALLGAQQTGRTGRYVSACHHPEGVPKGVV
jgi:hypothetical protein